jgi:hypothetical protein
MWKLPLGRTAHVGSRARYLYVWCVSGDVAATRNHFRTVPDVQCT